MRSPEFVPDMKMVPAAPCLTRHDLLHSNRTGPTATIDRIRNGVRAITRGVNRKLWPVRLHRRHIERLGNELGGPVTTPPEPRGHRFMTVTIALLLSGATVLLLALAFGRDSTGLANADAPLTAVVRCTTSGTEASSEVEAQPDGVHLEVHNDLASDPGLSVLFDGRGGGYSLLPNAVTDVVLLAPPGEVRVFCGVLDRDGLESGPIVEVVDPSDLYVSVELACSETAGLGTASGLQATALDAARMALEPFIDEGDTLEVAGYPQSSPRLVRLVRNDQVVAVATIVEGKGMKWRTDDVTGCASLLPRS